MNEILKDIWGLMTNIVALCAMVAAAYCVWKGRTQDAILYTVINIALRLP